MESYHLSLRLMLHFDERKGIIWTTDCKRERDLVHNES